MAEPTAELDARYSDAGATALPWSSAREQLAAAPLYWLSTVRPDGRPHVTPLIAVWIDDLGYVCTGGAERKAMNLAHNQQCVITTGTNALDAGLDLVVEAVATRIRDDSRLRRVADAYLAKYGEDWRFEVRDGDFAGGGGTGGLAQVYELRPVTGFGFSKGGYGQTRWRF